jgi:hypothetical protein
MARLLTHLAGLPYHGSPLTFLTCPQHTIPSTSTLGGLHPSLEGRGEVAASSGGVRGPKKNEKDWYMDGKMIILNYLL